MASHMSLDSGYVQTDTYGFFVRQFSLHCNFTPYAYFHVRAESSRGAPLLIIRGQPSASELDHLADMT